MRNEHDENRRARLVELIDWIRRSFPNYNSWDRDLINLANRDDWPEWALTALPPLGLANDQDEYYVWRFIADCVKNLGGIHFVNSTSIC